MLGSKILALILAALHPILATTGPTPGFKNIGSVLAPVTTFNDPSACADGFQCAYEITSYNSAGESGPSNIVLLTWPSTGTHSTTLNWTPGIGGGAVTGYNIYFLEGSTAPSATGTVN